MGNVAVPLLDLKAQYAGIKDEIAGAIQGVLESQHFVMGPEVQALEQEIAAYCDVPYAIGCASGSDALLLALMALDVKPGDEVICPAFTFFATAGAISRLGAVPVFADIDPASFNVTAGTLRVAADRCQRLRAIIPVHLYGQAVDVDAISALAKELGVPVVEDAAQAIGTRDASGHRVGSRSEIGCFSFFPSKNLGGYGDGGIVTTPDEALAERMRVLRLHGGKPKYYHRLVGMNSRLDAIQAAILRVKLGHLDDWSQRRRDNAATYDRLFGESGAVTGAGGFDDLALPVRLPEVAARPAEHIFNQYVLRVPADRRDALREHLEERQIGTEIYYPVPLHLQECFADLGYQKGDFPESETAAAESFAVPVYPELSLEQQQAVVAAIAAFFS